MGRFFFFLNWGTGRTNGIRFGKKELISCKLELLEDFNYEKRR